MSEMMELAGPAEYERSLGYMPYQSSLRLVLEKVFQLAPRGGSLADVMCGPGYLLRKIAESRPDLALFGVDIDKRYLSYAASLSPQITYVKKDAREQPTILYCDMVLCTGALHHIPYFEQELAIRNIAAMLTKDGVAIISDCYVDDFSLEKDRKLAAAKLGYEYLCGTVKNGAPEDVIEQTIKILHNDVLQHEFKTSLTNRLPLLQRHFSQIGTIKTWGPLSGGYGDYVHICHV